MNDADDESKELINPFWPENQMEDNQMSPDKNINHRQVGGKNFFQSLSSSAQKSKKAVMKFV